MADARSARQDLALRHRTGGDFYARSTFHRGRLDRSGLGRHGIRGIADLSRLAPMTLEDVATPQTLLLAPQPADKPLDPRGPVTPKQKDAHRYWPTQWVNADGVPIAYSAVDLQLLARRGAELYRLAGLSGGDVVANVMEPGPYRDYWQLNLGAHVAGISAVDIGPDQPAEVVDVLRPTAMVGDATELVRLIEEAADLADGTFDRIHTVIVVGEVFNERLVKRLEDRLAHHEGAVVRAWAPEGVLSLWGQCRGGIGLHTWPEDEVIELVDPLSGLPVPPSSAGQVVWTGTAWYATAMLRLQTNVSAAVVAGTCPTCGRTSPRLQRLPSAGGFARILEDNEHVASWIAELQRTPTGNDELVIWVAPNDPAVSLTLVSQLDTAIHAARISLVDEAEIDRRLADANGERFGDRRAL